MSEIFQNIRFLSVFIHVPGSHMHFFNDYLFLEAFMVSFIDGASPALSDLPLDIIGIL
jgi:hypothetical protein